MGDEKKQLKMDLFLILQLDAKIHYSDPAHVEKVYSMLLQKKPFKSPLGNIYLNRLERYTKGLSSEKCILCAKDYDDDNSVFCDACRSKYDLNRVNDTNNSVAKDANSKVSTEIHRNLSIDENINNTNIDYDVERQNTVEKMCVNGSSQFIPSKNQNEKLQPSFSDKDALKAEKGRLKVIEVGCGFGIFFFLIGLWGNTGSLDYGTTLLAMSLGGLLFFSFLVWLLFEIKKQKMGNRYVPYKGYKFFRKTAEEKIRYLRRIKYLTYGIGALYLLASIVANKINGGLVSAIALLIMVKGTTDALARKIKYHVAIDDATYFELEQLGLISDSEVVISLYKDFESWTTIEANSKILLLCQDSLVILAFSDAEHAQKVEIPLTKINRFRIVTIGNSKTIEQKHKKIDTENFGYLLSIGFEENMVSLYLQGNSVMDSPEEFIALLLHELDSRLTRKKKEEMGRPKAIEKDFDTVKIIRNISVSDALNEENVDIAEKGIRRNLSF